MKALPRLRVSVLGVLRTIGDRDAATPDPLSMRRAAAMRTTAVHVIGMVAVLLAPQTKGRQLPEPRRVR